MAENMVDALATVEAKLDEMDANRRKYNQIVEIHLVVTDVLIAGKRL